MLLSGLASPQGAKSTPHISYLLLLCDPNNECTLGQGMGQALPQGASKLQQELQKEKETLPLFCSVFGRRPQIKWIGQGDTKDL